MMQMVEELEPDVRFDCIWLFRISHKYYNFKSQYLYMKVITFKNLGERKNIWIYKYEYLKHNGVQTRRLMCYI